MGQSEWARLRRRVQLCVEPLEARAVPAAGLEHHLAPNMIDPTGHADGVDRVSWSNPGAPTTVKVFLNTRSGGNTLTPAHKARIRAAMAEINRTWDGSNGVRLVEVGSMAQANIRVQNSAASRIGGMAQGVFGLADYYTFDTGLNGPDGKEFHRFVGGQFGMAYQAKVVMITGWNWYAGARPSGIARSQYDYQTIVTQELAHAVGLDHDTRTFAGLNGDGKSVMLPWGMAGRPHRRLSPNDLASLRYLYASATAPSEGGLGSTGNAAKAQEATSEREVAVTLRGIAQPPLEGREFGVTTHVARPREPDALARETAALDHVFAAVHQAASDVFARRGARLNGESGLLQREHSNATGTFELPIQPMDAHNDSLPPMQGIATDEQGDHETAPSISNDNVKQAGAISSQRQNVATFSPGDDGAARALAFLLAGCSVLPWHETGPRALPNRRQRIRRKVATN